MADPISQRQARLLAEGALEDRPRPLAEAASEIGRWVGLAGSMITALAGWGILTAVQGDALVALLGAIPGVVTLVTAVLSAFGVVRRGEPLVTPLSDPRDDQLRALVAVPNPRAGDQP